MECERPWVELVDWFRPANQQLARIYSPPKAFLVSFDDYITFFIKTSDSDDKIAVMDGFVYGYDTVCMLR